MVGPAIGKNIVHKIISSGCFHLIGSDAHNNKKRNFCIKDAYDYLEDLYSIEMVECLKENANSILFGKDFNSISYHLKPRVKKNKLYKLKEKLFKFLS